MMKKIRRKIIKINEELCDGCGLCVPACPEQALQLIETPAGKKARLVKELYCDGLGACLGNCPTGALIIEEADAEPYNEEAVIARIREQAPDMLDTHLRHLQEHADEVPAAHAHDLAGGFKGCPSAQFAQWSVRHSTAASDAPTTGSELRQWPIQLHLVPPHAPFLVHADLVIVADCVPFAFADFHRSFLRDRAVLIACPKLDDTGPYLEKLTAIFQEAKPRSVQVVHMEVPCCFGLVRLVQEALERSGEKIPFSETTIGIKGGVL